MHVCVFYCLCSVGDLRFSGSSAVFCDSSFSFHFGQSQYYTCPYSIHTHQLCVIFLLSWTPSDSVTVLTSYHRHHQLCSSQLSCLFQHKHQIFNSSVSLQLSSALLQCCDALAMFRASLKSGKTQSELQ